MAKKNKTTGIVKSALISSNDGMIFKVQLSLSSSVKERSIYIYNEDRSAVWLQEYTRELMNAFGSEPKSFWYGYISPEGKITITSKAPWQSW